MSGFRFHQLAIPQLVEEQNLLAKLVFLCKVSSSGFLLACCGFLSMSDYEVFGAGIIFISVCCKKPSMCKIFLIRELNSRPKVQNSYLKSDPLLVLDGFSWGWGGLQGAGFGFN